MMKSMIFLLAVHGFKTQFYSTSLASMARNPLWPRSLPISDCSEGHLWASLRGGSNGDQVGHISYHASRTNIHSSSTAIKATLLPSSGEVRRNNRNDDPTSGDGERNYSVILGNLKPAMFGEIPYLSTDDVSAKGQHRVIFVLGGPGAGKGTQCERIVEKYKCVHLSAGDLLRRERERRGKHAELIEKCLVQGQIVPVEISLGLLKDAMDEAVSAVTSGKGVVFDGCRYGSRIFLIDGFPRNFDNLNGWTKLMPDHTSVMGSLVFDCPVEVLEQRILSRGETSGRSDDNLASARKRFTTFESQTMPAINVLEHDKGLQLCRVVHIAGENSLEEVWNSVSIAMDNFVQNDILTACKRLLNAISNRDADAYFSLVDSKMCLPSRDKRDRTRTGAVEAAADVTQLSSSSRHSMFFELECDGKGDQESTRDKTESLVSNTEVKIFGTNAVVSYDRCIINSRTGSIVDRVRETRLWHHKETGWCNVHFVRTPIL